MASSPNGSSFTPHKIDRLGKPRPRISRGPSDSTDPNHVSLSASRPFDWAAVRGEKPPPYGQPSLAPSKKKARRSTNEEASRPRVIRKPSWWKRAIEYPSQLWFDVTLLPETAPLPPPKVLGRSIGLACHVINLFVCYATAPDYHEPDDWTDMRQEIGGGAGIGAAWLLGWILFLTSIITAFFTFTRFRAYRLHLRERPVISPNAKVVEQDLDLEYKPDPPIFQRIMIALGRRLRDSWHFLMGTTLPPAALDNHSTVQELDIWSPGETELAYLTVYTPVHSMLYSILGWNNWMRVPVIMVSLSALLMILVSSFEQQVKDRAILNAEVMSEYNQKFVYPRLNPIRKDACVMTSEAEMVDYQSTPRDGYRHPAFSRAVGGRQSIGVGSPALSNLSTKSSTERLRARNDSSSRAPAPRNGVVPTPGGLLRF